MKRILFGLIVSMLMVCGASASFMGPNSNIQVSNEDGIATLTIRSSGEIWAVTPESTRYISGVDIHAVGADIRRCLGATTTEAYWTIPNNFTKTQPSDTITSYGIGKSFYFWVPSTATIPCTVEISYMKY